MPTLLVRTRPHFHRIFWRNDRDLTQPYRAALRCQRAVLHLDRAEARKRCIRTQQGKLVEIIIYVPVLKRTA